RRNSNRAARIRSPDDRREARRHRGAAPAARSARPAVWFLWRACLFADPADPRDSARQIMHVRFAEDDSARLPTLLHLACVVLRRRPGALSRSQWNSQRERKHRRAGGAREGTGHGHGPGVREAWMMPRHLDRPPEANARSSSVTSTAEVPYE